MRIMEPSKDVASDKRACEETNAPRELTGDEAALYDRQIRLWGLEAQRKLASASVLVTGDLTSLLTQEIAKNIVLAGISRLSFMTSNASKSQTESAQTFLGSSLSQIVESLKDMNPHVDVGITEGPVEALSEYKIVCAVGLHRSQELELSDRCRIAGVPFVTGRIAGPAGWIFFDLGAQYTYQEKSSSADGENEASVKQQTIAYCSYREAIDAEWKKEALRSEHGWHFSFALQEFDEIHGRFPGQQLDDSDRLLEIYERLRKEKKYDVPPKEKLEKVKDMLMSIGKAAHIVIPPVAAIVGGLWGREVIKVVSGKDEPLKNFFFFNTHTSAGAVELVGQHV